LDEGMGVDEILELALSGYDDSGLGSDDLKALLVAVQESDTGTGVEDSSVAISLYLLLKLLQTKEISMKLSNDGLLNMKLIHEKLLNMKLTHEKLLNMKLSQKQQGT
jgi:hypothetical protein